MEEVLSNAQVQYGALGLLIAILSTALSFVWRQWMKERKEWMKVFAEERKERDEERQQSRQELLDFSERILSSQAELQLVLKTLTDNIQIEQLFKEYSRKD